MDKALPGMRRALATALLLMAVDGTAGEAVGHVAYLPYASLSAVEPPPGRLELVGQLGGSVTAVALLGDTALVAGGARAVVFDVADPRAPRAIGASQILPGAVADIAVEAARAYILGSGGFLTILDLARPASPRTLGSVVVSGGGAHVAVRAGIACVAGGGTAGLRIVDVSDPASPREVGSLRIPIDDRFYEAARAVTMLGDRVCAVLWSRGLRLVDVSRPGEPRVLGEHPIASWSNGDDVVALGDHVYATGVLTEDGQDREGLHVFAVGNDLLPRPTGTARVAGAGGDLAVVAGVAYLRAADGLARVDVRDPGAPVLLATASEGAYESCRRLAVDGGLALIADPQAIAVVDVADAQRPTVVWQGSAIGPVHAVAAVPGHALVLSPDRLNVVDVADPARPVLEAALPFAGARTVALDGERGYVATCCSPRRLFVLDLSRPVEPALVGELSGVGDSKAARDGYVYAAGSEAVQVIDARDPRDPRLAFDIPIEGCRGAYPYTACVIDLAVGRGYMYVATTSPDAMHVLRLGDGEAHLVSKVALPSQPSGVAVAGPLAFVSIMDDSVERPDDGLLVFDVSSPSSPREIFRDTTPDRAWDVAAVGDRAYVVHSDLEDGAVRAYVIRQASTRVELLNEVTVPGRAQRLAVTGGNVFVAVGECGMLALQHARE